MIKLSKIVNWLYYLFILLVVGKEFPLDINDLIFNRGIQLVGTFLLIGVLRLNRLRGFLTTGIVNNVSLAIIIFFLGAFMSGFHKSNLSNFLIVFNVLGFLGFGLYTAYLYSGQKFYKRLFYLISTYFIIMIVMGVSIKKWLNGSYNHISVMAIFVVSMYYLEKYRNNSKTKLGMYPAIFTLVICLLSTGRSAILASSLMVSLIYLVDYISGRRLFRAIIVIVIAAVLVSEYLLDFIMFYTIKFQEQGFTEQGRFIIFDLFVKKVVEWDSLIFGVDYSRLYVEQNLTIHNSYLSMHSRFGIGVVLFFIIAFKALVRSFRYYKIGLVILLPLLFRSFTDTILISDGFLMGPLFFAIVFSAERASLLKSLPEYK